MAIATNLPLPHVTEIQFAVVGKVLATQDAPSFIEYAATVFEAPAIATHAPILLYAISFQVAVLGNDDEVQKFPTDDLATTLPDPAGTAIY